MSRIIFETEDTITFIFDLRRPANIYKKLKWMNEYSCALPIRHTTIMNDKKQNKTKKTEKKKGAVQL